MREVVVGIGEINCGRPVTPAVQHGGESASNPGLEQLKPQAKELLDGFLAGESGAAAEVNAYSHDANPANSALHDGQWRSPRI
jgi:hypothetical protein